MIVVFLCAAMSLACCQSNGILSRTSIGDDNDEIRRRYEADYTDRSNEEETMLENHETDLDSDDPFYERIVSYRSNRAIDVFRYSKVPDHPDFALRLTGNRFLDDRRESYLQGDRGSRYEYTALCTGNRNYVHT